MPRPATQPPPPPPARPLTPSEVETRTFDRGAPGYLPAHVDLFLAKAARALAGRDGETLTRWDVLRQRFPLGPRGYATNEVDAFLVRLAAQFPDPDPAAQQEILRKLQDGLTGRLRPPGRRPPPARRSAWPPRPAARRSWRPARSRSPARPAAG